MASPMEITNPDTDGLRRELFKYAMGGEWAEVVKIYNDQPDAYDAKITKSGDTALHIAVNDGEENIVKNLVTLISRDKERAKVALKVANERGNTPLHLAASLGNAEMCKHIAELDPSLFEARNAENETPLFLAALHGKTNAFLCLHGICGHDNGLLYCRGKDGETILHVAIAGEYFDLAFHIIRLYRELINYVDERGTSPLHILASKPCAFRSGSHLAGYKKLIYHCTIVDELKMEPSYEQLGQASQKVKHPENYETCMNFIWMLKEAIVVVTKGKHVNYEPNDLETPQGKKLFPPNYVSCFDFFKFVSKAMLIILGLGSKEIRRLEDKKKKHKWSVQIMNELLQHSKMYEYDQYIGRSTQLSVADQETKPYDFGAGGDITYSENIEEQDQRQQIQESKTAKTNQPNVQSMGKVGDEDKHGEGDKDLDKKNIAEKETPILIAAKNGITEMVEKILEQFPVAIHDMNSDNKNIVLLAVENRQPHVYEFLLSEKRSVTKESIFRKVDKEGNSALHLAATLGDFKPWRISGAALQMQWEIKWYEFVKNSMKTPHFFVRHNKAGKTPKDIFTDTHKDLVQKGGEWLTNTSESCSVVAALISTVAFATSATVPGGVHEDSGTPTLENQPAFKVFAISSLIALCFSVTAVVMFLAILTSRYQERDFGKDLPRKVLVGLTSLFVSIASILVSFCSGHFFVLRDELKYAAFPVYAVTCLPVTFFAVAQFPLYVDLVWATFKKVPQRSYMVVAL